MIGSRTPNERISTWPDNPSRIHELVFNRIGSRWQITVLRFVLIGIGAFKKKWYWATKLSPFYSFFLFFQEIPTILINFQSQARTEKRDWGAFDLHSNSSSPVHKAKAIPLSHSANDRNIEIPILNAWTFDKNKFILCSY